MKQTGIFYGSTTGVTADIANRLGKLLDVPAEDIHDVSKTSPTKFGEYEVLILGSSTWGNGELQDHWYDFIAGVEVLNLNGKKIALFGCGDETMSETFCNAVGILHDKLKDTEAEFIGEYPADGYKFNHSAASKGDLMCGLVLDQVNHPEWTDSRLKDWSEQIKKNF